MDWKTNRKTLQNAVQEERNGTIRKILHLVSHNEPTHFSEAIIVEGDKRGYEVFL